MLKKIVVLGVAAFIVKKVLDKVTGDGKDADLWAEATDTVEPSPR